LIRALWSVTCASLLALAAVTLAPDEAVAAPCCISATAFGVGRLLIDEQFAVGLNQSVAGTVGRWDFDRKFVGTLGGYTDITARTELWALVGAHRKVAFYGRAPLVTTHRAAGGLSETNARLGDVDFGMRVDAIAIGEWAYVPGIALLVSTMAPSGTPPWRSSTQLGADVAGRGAWILSFAVAIEEAVDTWFFRLQGGLTVPFENGRDDTGGRQKYGLGQQLALVIGDAVTDTLTVSGTLRFSREGPLSDNGIEQPLSGWYESGLALNVSWRADLNWTLQSGLDVSLPIDEFGANQFARITGNIGCRFGWF
jgi:hypothetical protein